MREENIHLSLPTITKTVTAVIRTAHFTQSSYYQMYLNSRALSLSFSLSQLLIWMLRLLHSDNYSSDSSKLHGNRLPNM